MPPNHQQNSSIGPLSDQGRRADHHAHRSTESPSFRTVRPTIHGSRARTSASSRLVFRTVARASGSRCDGRQDDSKGVHKAVSALSRSTSSHPGSAKGSQSAALGRRSNVKVARGSCHRARPTSARHRQTSPIKTRDSRRAYVAGERCTRVEPHSGDRVHSLPPSSGVDASGIAIGDRRHVVTKRGRQRRDARHRHRRQAKPAKWRARFIKPWLDAGRRAAGR